MSSPRTVLRKASSASAASMVVPPSKALNVTLMAYVSRIDLAEAEVLASGTNGTR
jgi:hypothetical protein